jgi:hypothetical protein
VAASTRLARVALLVADNPPNRLAISRLAYKRRVDGTSRVRKHILARFDVGTTCLSPSFSTNPSSLNEDPLILVIIETQGMPDTDIQGLAWALTEAKVVTPPPWDRGSPPGDTPQAHTDRPPTVQDRYHPLKRPRLNWYRADVPLLWRGEDDPPPQAPADSHNRSLGMMGHPPCLKRIHPGERQNPPPIPDDLTTEKISQIIHNASTEALRKSERWYKWKRRKRRKLT